MAGANLRGMLAAGRGGDLSPESGIRERHFGEAIVSGAARLHADIHAATGGGGAARIEDDAFRENKIDGSERGAANGEIVEDVFVDEIGDVADDGLRVDVVGGGIFRGGAFEIEDEPVAVFDEGEVAGADESGGPADGVVENDGAEFAVGEGGDFFARGGFG